MSRGPGSVQFRLLAAFEAEPSRRFTMRELAEAVWPGEVIDRRHIATVSHSLKTLPGVKLSRRREGNSSRFHHPCQGWYYRISAPS
jgi:hypothetical protein